MPRARPSREAAATPQVLRLQYRATPCRRWRLLPHLTTMGRFGPPLRSPKWAFALGARGLRWLRLLTAIFLLTAVRRFVAPLPALLALRATVGARGPRWLRLRWWGFSRRRWWLRLRWQRGRRAVLSAALRSPKSAFAVGARGPRWLRLLTAVLLLTAVRRFLRGIPAFDVAPA